MPPAIIAAAIGAGGTLLASSQANNAADRQISARQQATDQSLALQRQALAQTQTNQQPYLDAGAAATAALARQYGLAPPAAAGGQPGAPAGQPGPANYSDYLAANPDLAAEAQRVVGSDPRFPDVQSYLAWHDQTYGSEGRNSTPNAAPAAQPAQPTANPLAQAAQSYGPAPTFTRPDAAPAPTFGPSPSAGAYLGGANFQADPGYEFTRSEALRAIDAKSAAPGGGGFFSGARGKALEGRAADLANQTDHDWFNRQNILYQAAVGQYNTDRSIGLEQSNVDRNVGNQNYQSDRDFTQGQYDANRNFATNQANTATDNIFRLAAGGQTAAGALGAAGSSYANNSGNLLNTNANVLSDAYGQKATANATAVNNIFGAGQNLLVNAANRYPTGAQYQGDLSSLAGLY